MSDNVGHCCKEDSESHVCACVCEYTFCTVSWLTVSMQDCFSASREPAGVGIDSGSYKHAYLHISNADLNTTAAHS